MSARADRFRLVPDYFNVAFRQVLAFPLPYLTKAPKMLPQGSPGPKQVPAVVGAPVRKRLPQFSEGMTGFLAGAVRSDPMSGAPQPRRLANLP